VHNAKGGPLEAPKKIWGCGKNKKDNGQSGLGLTEKNLMKKKTEKSRRQRGGGKNMSGEKPSGLDLLGKKKKIIRIVSPQKRAWGYAG